MFVALAKQSNKVKEIFNYANDNHKIEELRLKFICAKAKQLNFKFTEKELKKAILEIFKKPLF